MSDTSKVNLKVEIKKWLHIAKRVTLILLQVYYIIFIPLQGGYRIQFTPLLITIEIFTILLYTFDVLILLSKYRNIKKNLQKIGFESESTNSIVWKSVDAEKNKLYYLRLYFITSILS